MSMGICDEKEMQMGDACSRNSQNERLQEKLKAALVCVRTNYI